MAKEAHLSDFSQPAVLFEQHYKMNRHLLLRHCKCRYLVVLITVFSLNLPIPAHADYRETYFQALNQYAAGVTGPIPVAPTNLLSK